MSKKTDFWETVEYFKQSEFDCKCGCGLNNVDTELVFKLNRARKIARTTFFITSSCRCKEHNNKVGGSNNSTHLDGEAFDIGCLQSEKRYKILNSLIRVGFTRIGIYKDFIHVDGDTEKSQNVIWHS